MNDAQPDGIQVQVQWLPDTEGVPRLVNQFMIQGGPPVEGRADSDGFIITLGSLVPPFFAPGMSPEQLAEVQATRPTAFVNTVGRFFFTADRLAELHEHLGRIIDGVRTNESGN